MAYLYNLAFSWVISLYVQSARITHPLFVFLLNVSISIILWTWYRGIIVPWNFHYIPIVLSHLFSSTDNMFFPQSSYYHSFKAINFITIYHGFCVICRNGDLLVLWGRGHRWGVRASTLIGKLQPQFVHLLHVSHCRCKKQETKSWMTPITQNTLS